VNFSILVELAKALSKEDFIERLPDPVLIVVTELERGEEASGEDDTQVGEQPSGGPSRVGKAEVPDRFDALAIRKKKRGTGDDRITLGRDRLCDIVVRTPGVSKQHAHFVPGKPLMIVDAGSQNGTFLDGKRLPSKQPVEVKAGAQLVFGDLTCRVIGPDELYVLLKSRKS
jgi:hypothetical protein